MSDRDQITASSVEAGHGDTPEIEQFVLYAERSVRLGRHSHARDGAVGVRTAAQPTENGDRPRGPAQLVVEKHGTCRDIYAPTTELEIYAEVGDVWTNSLIRDEDTAIGRVHPFPEGMPPVPLAPAMGRGRDITVARGQRMSLGPGTYGALTLLYESELWLAEGMYTFAGVRMDERSKLLGGPGGVEVHVVAGLWMDDEGRLGPVDEQATAKDFKLFVAGSDTLPASSQEPAVSGQTDADARREMRPVVSLGERAHMHALLAAPHGTVELRDDARVKGAVAGFDIAACDRVCAEHQDGFPSSPAGQQGSQQLHGYFGTPSPSVAPLAGPVPVDTQVSLAIGLPVRDPEGLQSFITSVSDPKSITFRQFLTQEEFNSTYGATASDYAALQSWASEESGFAITSTYANNLLLSVTASAAEVEQALYVNLVYRRREDGSQFVTVDRDPSLDLSVPVLEISGLNDYVLPYPAQGTGGCPGASCGATFRAADLRNAYLGVGSGAQALDGSGQVIGLVGFDVFDLDDIKGYANLQLPAEGQPALPPADVVIVQREGGNPLSGSNEEATLDVEMAYAMAPGAQILFFQGSTGITSHLDDILHAMATSTPPLTVASSSLGFGYSDNSNQALGMMAATGVTFFQASGDSGDIGSNDPNNLKMVNQTLVGGTILSTNLLTNPFPNPVYPDDYYAGEATWTGTDTSGKLLATGGGIMNGVAIPDYQLGVSMASNGGSTTSRNYPDVAMVASGVEIFFGGAVVENEVGTSFAAPLWAGYMALVNQLSQKNGGPAMAGFINPTLYAIGLTAGTADDLYSVCFNDIADGVSNRASGGGSGFVSATGYDLCTGWGTPTPALINQLSSSTPLTPNQPLSLVEFVITTGGDDLGGGLHGSSATAEVFLNGGSSGSFTVTLRNSNDPNWENGSTHVVDFPIPSSVSPPLTASHGIAGVQINLVQNNPDWSADNWDIANLGVSLYNPGSPKVCQLNLIGDSVLQDGSTGLVRLSKRAGSSGSGPSSPVYDTGPGSGC